MGSNLTSPNLPPSLRLKHLWPLQDRIDAAAKQQTTGAPLSFRDFIALVNPRYQFYRHCDELIAVLQRVADDELHRVMVFMPPRHSKSETVSRLFTAYYLYRHPERFVGLASYGADLAYTLSRAARENFMRAGGQLNQAAKAVKQWLTTAGGGFWAAGVGGPATGKGFHLGVIDDPLKDAEQAASETIRAKQKDWFGSVFSTREEPGGAIVVLQTRWHEDDLSGYLLTLEADEPERWHIVNMPAIAEARTEPFPATCTVQPDWRQDGEALCPERYPLDKLTKLAKRIGEYFFGALFQQRPRPRDGGMFKRPWFEIVPAAPVDARRVRYWDKASTAGAGDYTVGLRMARGHDGFWYIEDVVRGQWSSGQRDTVIKQTAALDGDDATIWGEQEPGSGGKDSADAFVRMLAGYPVYVERATGDKQTRAEPFAAQCEARNVKLVQGTWNKAYLDELCTFPNGTHDDQVDTSSGAFNKLTDTGSLLLW